MKKLLKLKLSVIIAISLMSVSVFASSIPEETIVAEFNGGKITMGDVNYKISKIPSMYQTKYNSLDGKKNLLDIMCTEEIFYLEALKLGLDKDKEVLESIETQKINNLAREYKKELNFIQLF